MKRLLALCIGASLLASCGGGGGSSHLIPSPSATGKSSSPSAKVQVSIRVLVPTANKARKAAAANLRRALDVSSSTQGASVTAYSGSDSGLTTPLASTVVNLSAISPPTPAICSTPDPNDNRTCTFTIGAPAGSDIFVMKTYDAVPSGGAVAGNQLGIGTTAQAITTGSVQTVGFTLNSVLNQIAVTMVPDTVHYILTTAGTAIVVGQDADGNAIVSNSYIDGNGNPLSIGISADSTGSPYLNFNPSAISAPSANGIPFTFAQSGNSNVSGPGPYSSTITAQTTTGTTISGTTNLAIVYPTFTAFADANLGVAGSFNGGAFFNTATGAFIYTTQSTAGIDVLSGGTVTQNSEPISGGLATANGNIYVAGPGGFYRYPQTGSGALTALCVVQTSCPPANGSAVAVNSASASPPTDAYYVSGNNLVDYKFSSDSYTETQIPAITSGGIAVDGTGQVWISDNVATGSEIYITPATGCTSIANCAVTFSGNMEPGDVVTDPTGDCVWVGDRAYGYIVQVNSSHFVQTYDYTADGLSPWHLAFDPNRPHILWYDTILNGQIAIGRLDTQTGDTSIAENDIPYPPGLPQNEQPGALALDQFGNIYMVYDGGGDVVEVTP